MTMCWCGTISTASPSRKRERDTRAKPIPLRIAMSTLATRTSTRSTCRCPNARGSSMSWRARPYRLAPHPSSQQAPNTAQWSGHLRCTLKGLLWSAVAPAQTHTWLMRLICGWCLFNSLPPGYGMDALPLFVIVGLAFLVLRRQRLQCFERLFVGCYLGRTVVEYGLRASSAKKKEHSSWWAVLSRSLFAHIARWRARWEFGVLSSQRRKWMTHDSLHGLSTWRTRWDRVLCLGATVLHALTYFLGSDPALLFCAFFVVTAYIFQFRTPTIHRTLRLPCFMVIVYLLSVLHLWGLWPLILVCLVWWD